MNLAVILHVATRTGELILLSQANPCFSAKRQNQLCSLIVTQETETESFQLLVNDQ